MWKFFKLYFFQFSVLFEIKDQQIDKIVHFDKEIIDNNSDGKYCELFQVPVINKDWKILIIFHFYFVK